MKRSWTLLFLIPLFLPQFANAQAIFLWESRMAGSDVVPPNDSPGWAQMECWFPPDGLPCESWRDSLHVDFFNYGGLQGDVTSAELRKGFPGENGEMVVQLRSAWFPSGSSFRVWIPEAACDDLNGERLHVLVKTGAYPEGEIRGHLLLRPTPTEVSSWGLIRALYH